MKLKPYGLKLTTLKQRRKMSKIILISGFKRAGKDFIGQEINKGIKGSMLYSFAEPLKEIVADSFSISLDDLDGLKNNCSPIITKDGIDDIHISDFRTFLQLFGTEAMKKHFGKSVWVDLFKSNNFAEDYIIIPDWRFPTEFEELIDGDDEIITLRVDDDNNQNTDRHSSETALESFNFDYRIDNTAKDSSVLKEVQKFIEDIK